MMQMSTRRFRSIRVTVKLFGFSLILIGISVNVALHWNIDKTWSPDEGRIVDNFYCRTRPTADPKVFRYVPSDHEAEIESEIEIRLQSATDKKVYNNTFLLAVIVTVHMCIVQLYDDCYDIFTWVYPT